MPVEIKFSHCWELGANLLENKSYLDPKFMNLNLEIREFDSRYGLWRSGFLPQGKLAGCVRINAVRKIIYRLL